MFAQSPRLILRTCRIAFWACVRGIVHSNDGDRWTAASAVAAEQLEQLRDVAWGRGRFGAVGVADGSGTILHSVDGDQWTPASDPAIDNWFFVVAHGGTHFIAIALDGGW